MNRHFYYNQKLSQFNKFSTRLNKQIVDGSFYRLSKQKQAILVNRLKKLYRQLLEFFPPFNLKRLLAGTSLTLYLLITSPLHSQNLLKRDANPFGLTGTNYLAFPTAVDIDDDGDFDLFVGEYYGNIQFFENTGSANSPKYTAPQANPFGVKTGYYLSAPSFVDIDSDGDLDLFVGTYYGNIQFQENLGSSNTPSFTDTTYNPFGITAANQNAFPTFVDIDNDGDFDLFVGEYYGNIQFFENIGDSSLPSFATPQLNPFGIEKIDGYIGIPAFADVDEDGDLDLFMGGEDSGGIVYFENIGTNNFPAFTLKETNPFGIENTLGFSAPTFADIDGDSDLDLFVGEYYGAILYYENVTIPEDIGIEKVIAPGSSCGLSSTDTLKIVIKNYGTNEINNFDINYSINGTTSPFAEAVFTNLQPGDTMIYSFISTFDFSTTGAYSLDIWTITPADSNLFNDTLIQHYIVNQPNITDYPYSNNFDTTVVYWYSDGINNSWDWGLPGNNIPGAASGTSAWVTALSGQYNNNEASYVESPCFDLSSLTVPMIDLNIWYETEGKYDGSAIYYTTDNGNNWTIIGATGDKFNWYNDKVDGLNTFGSQDGWAGSSAGWINAKHKTAEIGGESNVKFRVVFGSDIGVIDGDGFAFDDFQVYEAPPNNPPTASNNTVTVVQDNTYTFDKNDFNFTDVDSDGLTKIKITSLETVGDLKLNGANVVQNQEIDSSQINLLTYTPLTSQSGNNYDNFQFDVNDGTEYSSISYTMTINVQSTTGISAINPTRALYNTYPNPVKEILTIEIKKNHASSIKLELLNLLGETIIVEHSNAKDIHYMDLSGIAKGTYILKLSHQRSSIIKKIIVE